MKYSLLAILTLSSFSSFSQSNIPDQTKVVYGTDDRKDLSEVTNQLYLRLAKSTAAMFQNSSLSADGIDRVLINSGTLETEMQVCSEEKFSQQMAGAYCSGFLVGPDLLLTAGHCVRDQNTCNTTKWIFDFNNTVSTTNRSVKASNVFRCKSIVSRTLDEVTMHDFALIKLDRIPVGRAPLKYRTEGKIADGASLVVIGHPSGLPTKVADNASVRGNLNPIYFSSNLDTFGGNSGGAVFDARTGIVEGILVRGADDYIMNDLRRCRNVNYFSIDGGRGEDVTRITRVVGLPGVNPYARNF